MLPVLLSFALWVTFKKALIDSIRYGDTFLRSLLGVSLGCVVAFVVSTFHTNALMRPQLFPILFIFLAIISIVRKAVNGHLSLKLSKHASSVSKVLFDYRTTAGTIYERVYNKGGKKNG